MVIPWPKLHKATKYNQVSQVEVAHNIKYIVAETETNN